MQKDSSGSAAQVGRYVGSPTLVTLPSATAVLSAKLRPNTIYEINYTVSGTFKWGDINVVATANDHPCIAGSPKVHKTDSINLYVSCKVGTSGVVTLGEIALD